MQRKLLAGTDEMESISRIACELFDERWNGKAIRQLGVRVSELCCNEFYQTSIFEFGNRTYARRHRRDRLEDYV